ncbi:MAG: transcriptional regulator, partial [Cyanobacteria bacterium J06614_10]
QRIGVQSWSAEHQNESFKLNANNIFTGVINGLSFWSHENVGISIADEVDEIALALVTDAYSRTLRSKVSLTPANDLVKTKRGLAILPSKVSRANKRIDRTIELRNTLPPVSLLDMTLQEIEQLYGAATAKLVALQLEYPAHR